MSVLIILDKQYEEYIHQKEEIERLNNIIKEQGIEDKPNYYVKGLEGSLKEYQEEVKRLNNIIEEIEKYAGLGELNWEDNYQDIMLSGKGLLKRIKELKGSDK